MKRDVLTRLILTGFFIALGILLPFLTAQNPMLGSRLLLMHIPVLVCGFACGWPYGMAAGFITPLFRSSLLTMPPMFPDATAMAFELAAYGFLTGLLFHKLPKKPIYIYVTLIISMVGGRLVWGPVRYLLAGLSDSGSFTFSLFLAGAFVNALPGIILQIVLIPILIMALQRAGLIQHET